MKLARRVGWLGVLFAVGLAACGDEVVVPQQAGDGAKCGSATCKVDEYCCDAACGLCVPQNVACEDSCE